ncbi:MAG: nickel-dependent lactate racemase [Candidatus Korarchaeum sp.]
MRVSVLYGSERIWFELPDDRYIGSFSVKEPGGIDEATVVERSLENPIGPKLEDLDARKVLISVNDATRLIPTPRLLDHILRRVRAELRIMVATGSHRAPTEEEYRDSILGHHYDSLRRMTVAHDAKRSDFVDLGTTSRGTPILVNRELFEHDLVITLSSVEPHYFAGYSGGRKMIAPGLCMYETIERNHKLALLPEAALGKLEGNPVHEDLEEIAKAVAKEVRIFSVNTAISGEGHVWAAESGDLFDSFYAIIRRVEENYSVSLPEEPEVVVAVAPKQMGIDLYQAQKAIEAAKLVTRKGGVIILVAPCWDGIGPRNFYDLLTSGPIEEVRRRIWEGYKLGYHKAAKLIEALENYRILAVTGLEDDVLRRIGIEPFRSVQEAVDEALSSVKGGVAVLPEASVCVPRVSR